MSDPVSINYIVAPGGALKGRFRLPGDKSISHRALMLSAIAEGQTRINGFLEGEDTLATLSAFRAMGVEITHRNQQDVVVNGVGLHGLTAPSGPLDLGNSGTSVRLLAGLLSGQSFNSELIGDASLMRRPMRRVTQPLQMMNADITCTQQGTLPIKIRGGRKLHGIDYALPIVSAQLKSCLLLAGLYAEGKTCIHEPAQTRDHTERMLEQFGYVLNMRNNPICITGGGKLRATEITVPGDISSAAFFIVGACISEGSEITLEQVGINPTRDAVIHILKSMGADITVNNPRIQSGEPVGDIRVRSSQLHGIEIPLDLVPAAIDEFPAIMIAAASANNRTVLKGAAELRVKESDRIMAMTEGLKAIGINAKANEDGMEVEGGRIRGGVVDSFNDHRVAMAFAMAGLVAKDLITIKDCANVNTSFPGFVDLADQAGLGIRQGDAGAR